MAGVHDSVSGNCWGAEDAYRALSAGTVGTAAAAEDADRALSAAIVGSTTHSEDRPIRLPGTLTAATKIATLTKAAATAMAAVILLAACQAPSPGSDSVRNVATGSAADSATDSATDSVVDAAVDSIRDSIGDATVESPADSTTPLTPDGWGPLRIGMSREEVVATAGEDANPDAVGGVNPEQCDEFRPIRAPDGMIAMLERNRLTRLTLVAGSQVSTEAGFSPGDRAADIRRAYGDDATATPHKYMDPPAEYITVWRDPPPAEDPRGIVYEIGLDGLVSHIHAGGASIQYVEGCL